MASDFVHNELSGSLFKNERRTKDSQPMYQGSCVIGGEEYWISAWINESKSNGKKYMGLKFEPKEQKFEGTPPSNDDDDIPF
jgi:hypothetical protein